MTAGSGRAIEFEIGDLFPADDRVSRWITVCCIALNDTLPLNVRLMKQLERDDVPAWSSVYLARLVASHLHEVGRFLAESERKIGTELGEVLDDLPSEARTNYERVKALWPGESPAFAKGLKTLRNHSFHYAGMVPHAEDYESLRLAMIEVAENESRIVVGKVFKDFRADFADDVATALVFPGTEGLRDFISELAETVVAFNDFVQHALAVYLSHRPKTSYRVVA